MKFLIFIIFTFFSIQLLAQELHSEDGLYLEKSIKSDTSRHRYSVDNKSYKINSGFTYNYYYLDVYGKKMKFLMYENYTDENPLNLTPYNQPSYSAIDNIQLKVIDFLDVFEKVDPSYSQTVCGYNYLYKTGKRKDTLCDFLKKKGKQSHPLLCVDEATGIVDNYKNLWIHPPRDYGFKILELNPFPFQCLDESKKSWAWQLEVGGDLYLDPRWIKWKEKILIKYNYVRAKDEIVSTKLGSIKCKVTNAIAYAEYGSSFMKTFLKSYYHPDYGFVKLEYVNINGSKIVIELIDKKIN